MLDSCVRALVILNLSVSDSLSMTPFLPSNLSASLVVSASLSPLALSVPLLSLRLSRTPGGCPGLSVSVSGSLLWLSQPFLL